jgi:IS605 OrfB family transposase
MKAKKSKVKLKVDEYQIQETPSSKDRHLGFSIVKKTPKKKEEKSSMEVLEFKIHPTKEQITEIDRSLAACKLLWNLSITLKEESKQRYYRKKHKFDEFSPEIWELSYSGDYDEKEFKALKDKEKELLIGNPCCKIAYFKKTSNGKEYTPLDAISIRRFMNAENIDKDAINYLNREKLAFYFREDTAKFIGEIETEFKKGFFRSVIKPAYDAAKKGIRGIPKFKGRRDKVETLVNGQPETIKIESNGVIVSSKIGLLKVRGIDRLQGKAPRMAKITRKATGYYLQLTIETDDTIYKESNKCVGLDMGAVAIFTDDLGRQSEAKRYAKIQKKRLNRLQRQASRQKDNSNNQRKTYAKLARVHEKIARQRKGRNAQLAHKITSEYQSVILEDLKLKNMTAAAKPKEREDGDGYKQNGKKRKSGLNKALLDNAIGQLRTFIENKANERGRKVIRVNPKYTSQTCPNCGNIDKANRVSQSKFKCTSCGYEAHADQNAAANILIRGLRDEFLRAISSLIKFPVSLIGKYPGLAGKFTPDLDANQESIGDVPIENAEHSISKQIKQEGNRTPTQSENDSQSLIFSSAPSQPREDSHGINNPEALPNKASKRSSKKSRGAIPENPDQLTIWDLLA